MEAIVIRLYFMKRMMLDGNIKHDLFEVKRQQTREDQKDMRLFGDAPDHGLLTEEHRIKIAKSGLIDIHVEMQALCAEFYENRARCEYETVQGSPEQHGTGEP